MPTTPNPLTDIYEPDRTLTDLADWILAQPDAEELVPWAVEALAAALGVPVVVGDADDLVATIQAMAVGLRTAATRAVAGGVPVRLVGDIVAGAAVELAADLVADAEVRRANRS